MKKTILFTFLSILLFSFAASAQIESDRYTSSRLENLTDQLKRDTVDLADRTSEELRKRNSNRNDIQSAFLATATRCQCRTFPANGARPQQSCDGFARCGGDFDGFGASCADLRIKQQFVAQRTKLDKRY